MLVRRKFILYTAVLFWGTLFLSAADSSPRVLNGIDVLRERNFDLVAGKHIGLITNHTGTAADGKTTIDLLFNSGVCKLVAIFSPEHGIGGVVDDKIVSTVDDSTSLPVYSLYGETRRPTAEMLKGIDALVFDIQDVGARFYTYITTMAYCMEEASKANIPFYVLDRPNPVGGIRIEGPMLDPDKTSFIGYMPLPVRHGMTAGEIAQYFNREKKIGADLHIVKMKGWRRSYYFWDTGQLWQNPSPNIRNMLQTILYLGVCLLESTNVSVGRGTDRPFEVIGAPWIEPRRLAAELTAAGIPGVAFVPIFFTPNDSMYRGINCGGVNLVITGVEKVNSVFVGLSLISVLSRLYRDEFEMKNVLKLLGSQEAMKKLEAGRPPAVVLQTGVYQLQEFKAKRQKALIYGVSPRPKKERQ
jgi:uncharacterized protein YbbC (DUF1343 family)